MKKEISGNILDRVITFFGKFVETLSILFLGVICGISIFRTCSYVYVEDGITYHNFFYRDSVIKHFLFISLFLFLVFVRRFIIKKRLSNIAIYIVLAMYAILGIVFVCTTKWYPANDSYDIWEIARGLDQGYYAEFEKEGYMYRYPFQRGMVLVLFFLIKIFGENAFWVYQIVNVLATVVTVITVVGIEKRLRVMSYISNATGFMYVLFIPMLLYVTFVYGTTFGLMFVTGAIYSSIRAIEDESFAWGIASAILGAISIQLKSNYSIWIIAIVLTMIGEAVSKKNRQGIIAVATAALIILVSGLSGTITKVAIEHVAPVEISRGMPKTTWIVMGISDDDDRPGAFNGKSCDTFRENEYDYDRANDAALKDIRAILGYTAKRPFASVKQYYKKISFMWNDPTFESINNLCGRPSLAYEESRFYESLLQGKLRKILEEYMNVTQTLYLMLALFFMIRYRKYMSGWYLLPALIFVGGFVFHLAWEVKPQYAYPYYMVLIPYVGAGIVSIFNTEHNVKDN